MTYVVTIHNGDNTGDMAYDQAPAQAGVLEGDASREQMEAMARELIVAALDGMLSEEEMTNMDAIVDGCLKNEDEAFFRWYTTKVG